MAEGEFALDLTLDSVSPFTSLTDSAYASNTISTGSNPSISLISTTQITEFVKDLPERYKCNICKQVALNPTQSECGHLFCKSCIEEYFDSNPGTTVCPNPDDEDCKRVTKKGLFLDKGALRELRKQKVYCSNKSVGCPKIMTWSELRQHQAVCTYTNNGTQGDRTEEFVDNLNSATTTQLQLKATADGERSSQQAFLSMEAFSLRLQQLEATSFDGTLVWNIVDYLGKKQTAIDGQISFIDSQHFYTGRYGYKMCARVYLNGDGFSKGTHVSIFFVVMKGEYDALLPWPFRQKVTLMLLDQDSGKQHLSDNFNPDPSSSSFRRPVAEMNEAFGPWEVGHNVLERVPYLIKDVIFFKVAVDKFTHGMV